MKRRIKRLALCAVIVGNAYGLHGLWRHWQEPREWDCAGVYRTMPYDAYRVCGEWASTRDYEMLTSAWVR